MSEELSSQLIYPPSISWENLRFAVVDSESTGVDADRDRLISIGGVSVERLEIQVFDSFEILMPIAYNTSSVTLHGITKDEAESGVEEKEAIKQFLNWLGDAVIVGHHIEHDIKMFNRSIEANFGFSLKNPFIDTMDLALRCEKAGAFGDKHKFTSFGLDALCEEFKITPHDRHTASGDAFITAQVFIRLLRAAIKSKFLNLGELAERYESPKKSED